MSSAATEPRSPQRAWVLSRLTFLFRGNETHAHSQGLPVDVQDTRALALHLVRTHRVQQGLDEVLRGLYFAIDHLREYAESGPLLLGLATGQVQPVVRFYQTQVAKLEADLKGREKELARVFLCESVFHSVISQTAALKAAQLAALTDPENELAWTHYATMQMCCGQFAGAEASFARATKLQSG